MRSCPAWRPDASVVERIDTDPGHGLAVLIVLVPRRDARAWKAPSGYYVISKEDNLWFRIAGPYERVTQARER